MYIVLFIHYFNCFRFVSEFDICASYMDMLLNIDSNSGLTTTLYDKGDDFHFPIVNFPFVCSDIPLSPSHGVYISQNPAYLNSTKGARRICLVSRQCLPLGCVFCDPVAFCNWKIVDFFLEYAVVISFPCDHGRRVLIFFLKLRNSDDAILVLCNN
jgi:hypothetical protein